MNKRNNRKGAPLGQHFLVSKTAISKIAEAGEIKENDTILEIGAGQGVLTEVLLKKSNRVFSVEKDSLLIQNLKKRFEKEILNKKLILIEKDIRNFDPFEYGLKNNEYKIIANIPYYITGFLIKKFLEEKMRPSLIVFLIQKEVAERISAKDKKEGLLSMSVKVFGTPNILGIIKAGSFNPPPKVDSAILKIKDVSNKNLRNEKEKKDFFNILKFGFSHKRKKLSANLKPLFKDTEKMKDVFYFCQIKENSRAEELSLSEWLCLKNKITQNP